MSDQPLVDVTMHVHTETAAAVLASDDGEEGNAVWLPKSQIEMEPLGKNTYEITMPAWLAGKHKLL